MAKFQEVSPFLGVDESATPTGIIVPLGPGRDKFNVVRLTGGRGIRPQPPQGSSIKIDEITGVDVTMQLALSFGRNVVPSLSTMMGDRLFMISGILPGTKFQVQAGGDTLRIAVLKPRTVKLAIRPIQVRNPQGPLVNHSKVPIGDIDAMVDQMNAIWTPQANVVFTLVSKAPAPFIDEAKIGNIAGKSLGPAFQGPAPLPDDVDMEVFKDLLFENRDPNAELTMFLVQRCSEGTLSNKKYKDGETRWELGISLISDSRARYPAVMAHEAGHFLGKMYGHTDDPDSNGNFDHRKQLMVGGGGALASNAMGSILIPFDLVISKFNPQK